MQRSCNAVCVIVRCALKNLYFLLPPTPLRQSNAEYDPGRCFAFVHDLSEESASFPVPQGSLDVIVLIFVLSALHPDK